MKKTNQTSESDKIKGRKSRREFLSKALLGTSALVLTPLSDTSAVVENPSVLACNPINPADLKDNWNNPAEYDAANPFNPPLFLNVVQDEDGKYTYNGSVPGPTIRAKGDTHIKVNLMNNLSGNNKTWAADNNSRYVLNNCQVDPSTLDWQITDWHVYGSAQKHTTNLHTHGLHVAPAVNQIDGSNSDNVLLKIIPLEDYANRYPVSERSKVLRALCEEKYPDIKPTEFLPLKDNERVYASYYDFRLEDQGPIHYPGTFWYHPHPHGATYDQVSGGMAGFIIIEGDVDQKLAEQIKNTTPEGRNLGIRERLILQNRIILLNPESQEDQFVSQIRGNAKNVLTNFVDGEVAGSAVFTVRRNAIERWRLLNASIDGLGSFKYMVVDKNAFDQDLLQDCITINGVNVTNLIKKYRLFKTSSLDQICSIINYDLILDITLNRANAAANNAPTRKGRRSAKCQYELTYTNGEGYSLYYDAIAQLNALLAKHSTPTNSKDANFTTSAKLHNLSYDGITLVTKDNQYTSRIISSIHLDPANRADFLFQAPPQAGVYTFWAAWDPNTSDRPDAGSDTNPFLILSTIAVQDKVKEGSEYKELPPVDSGVSNKADGNLDLEFPPVNPLLKPISIEDCKDQETGLYRKRKLTYGGWGNSSIPLSYVYPPENPVKNDTWNTMTIDEKKYGTEMGDHMDHGFPPADIQMEEGTREEWTIENFSMTIYYDPNTDKMVYGQNFPKVGKMSQISNPPAYGPVNPNQSIPYAFEPDNEAEGVDIKNLITKATDHPFHIHQNAFWVLSIKNNSGEELLPTDNMGNPYPRWQDVVRIPRNGGRVVIRCPFDDYHGKFVNHCHLLRHEDWGMMQVVEVLIKGKKPKEGTGPAMKSDPCFQWERPNLLQLFDENFSLKYLNPEEEAEVPPNFPPFVCKQKITQDCNSVENINTNKFLTTSVAQNFTEEIAKQQPDTLSDNKVLYPGTRCG